jgi:hypothetical protein
MLAYKIQLNDFSFFNCILEECVCVYRITTYTLFFNIIFEKRLKKLEKCFDLKLTCIQKERCSFPWSQSFHIKYIHSTKRFKYEINKVKTKNNNNNKNSVVIKVVVMFISTGSFFNS